ncbi:hypothetical protein K461DRAFT_320885 [Myriangium duriaei CBS 260.36]|uniref:Uncharacterized protein n=1 Tax=Myriangium duriaei CBS 260.36 TaxID=1168546 RepID=A0A9P4J0Z5_9PEZI|nr:hypothetical protein K461DRAFT_320885 [Myriangium duriaei CBS 260.36]
MNTRASVAYGWGVLIAAGGGAYYFAKRSINADRAERAEAEERRKQAIYRLQYGAPPPPKKSDSHANPGQDAHEGDVAPAASREAPDSKYESSKPFRSPKGDRFS